MQSVFAFASGSVSACEHVIVELETNDKRIGRGSIVTMPWLYGDTTSNVVSAVKLLKSAAIGQDPFDIETIHSSMEKLMFGNAHAKAAIDFACHDLMGQLTSLPVCKLIGGQYRDRIDCTWVIGFRGVDERPHVE